MSRVIVKRHPNGEEALSAGYDRPLSYFFVDRYDEDGEYIDGIGLLGSGPCATADDAVAYLREHGVDAATADHVRNLLRSHIGLDYPASNVTVDLTR